MENTINQTYETSDLAQATYLYCSGVDLISINRNNPRRCIFVFKSPDPELISKWNAGLAEVNAMAFSNAYQSLKLKMFKG